MEEQTQEKQSFFSKVKSYPIRRMGRAKDGRLLKIIQNDGGRIFQIFKPEKVSPDDIKKGISGRYEDGGRQQFALMAARMRMKEDDLKLQERQMKKISLIFLGAAGLSAILMVLWPIMASGFLAVLSVIGFFLLTFVFVAMATKFDFGAWQIRVRRFGGFQEYLNERF